MFSLTWRVGWAAGDGNGAGASGSPADTSASGLGATKLADDRRTGSGFIRGTGAGGCIQGGRPDTAQTVLAEAIRRDPARAPLYKNMALAWLRRGQPDSALVWLDEAGRRDSTLASVWQVRAEAAARRHDTAAARRSLSRFIALGGDSATAASLAVELGLTSTR